MAGLLDEYAAIAQWDVSTRQTNEGVHPPHDQARPGPPGGAQGPRPIPRPAVRAAEALRRPGLHRQAVHRAPRRPGPGDINSPDPRPAWQQVPETLTEAIRSGTLAPGDELASIAELSALQGIGTGVIRRALETLAADGLIVSRRGQAPIVSGTAAPVLPGARKRPGPGHDCRRAGCRPHVCHPMKASTIRGIHSILSGAFAAAQRWECTDRNPAESANPPATIRRPIPATSPDGVATVIARAREHSTALGHRRPDNLKVRARLADAQGSRYIRQPVQSKVCGVDPGHWPPACVDSGQGVGRGQLGLSHAAHPGHRSHHRDPDPLPPSRDISSARGWNAGARCGTSPTTTGPDAGAAGKRCSM